MAPASAKDGSKSRTNPEKKAPRSSGSFTRSTQPCEASVRRRRAVVTPPGFSWRVVDGRLKSPHAPTSDKSTGRGRTVQDRLRRPAVVALRSISRQKLLRMGDGFDRRALRVEFLLRG
jgi:hypothetical protein